MTRFDWQQIQEAAGAAVWTNLSLDPDPPPITGDNRIDRRWRRLAVGRGYRRQPAVADISQLQPVGQTRHRLQRTAVAAFAGLQQAARTAGHPLTLTSAYRDYGYQAKLFLGQLDQPYRDKAVIERLRHSALPGYSKHHTGYTVDLAEGDYILDRFVDSGSYRWLAGGNFANARRWGWVPSYPASGNPQGPDPEPWEMVWVGDVDRLAAGIR